MLLLLAASSWGHAAVLFRTGFEPNTTIGARADSAICPITGKDMSTGYRWPINLGAFMDAGATGIQCLTEGSPWKAYMEPSLAWVVGPHGTRTHVLHLDWKQGSPPDQQNFKLGFAAEPPGLYTAYWVKYDTEMLTMARTRTPYWRNVWEMKACLPHTPQEQIPAGRRRCQYDLDARVLGQIGRDRATGEPAWFVVVDCYAPKRATQFSQAIPMTAGERKKLEHGEWLRMEFYFYRNPDHVSNGRFLWKIDGRTIIDKQDTSFWGAFHKEQIFQFPFATYSQWPRAEVWVDDLEIRDTIPAATDTARAPGRRPLPHP